MTGKTIRICLVDGEPTGILLAEISNWTGEALFAPRFQLRQLSKREEVRRTGVYILVGPPTESGVPAIYFGEAEQISTRREQHASGKDFWTTADGVTLTLVSPPHQRSSWSAD